MEKNVREDAAKVPELEATLINKKLRRQLPNVPLSVSAMVDKKNRRIIHIAADNPSDPLNDRADLYYNADSGVDKIIAAAKKKLSHRFVL